MPVTSYGFMYERPLQWGAIATLDDAQIWMMLPQNKMIYPAGFGVVQGTKQGQVRLPSGVGDRFYGIIRHVDIYEKRVGYSVNSAGYYGFPENEPLSILRGGKQGVPIAVPIATAVNEGDAVHLQVITSASNTAATPGIFRNAADGTSSIALAGARWYRSSAAPSANTLGTGYLEFRVTP